MSQSRYRESRTLVRRLCRLPGEDRDQFKHHISRLREHFERFNVDTAELCQWMMGLRKRNTDINRPDSFGVLGDFLLEPNPDGQADESRADPMRKEVFDFVAGFHSDFGKDLPLSLIPVMQQEAGHTPTPTARKLLDRLRALEPGHRLVLLKAAVEWIVARYQRGVQNWMRQHAEWEKEKTAWESQRLALTPQLRDQFTNIFKQLNDPECPGVPGLRRKNPRLCTHDRLKQNLDNCCYAGQKGHGPLCWKYQEFVKHHKAKGNQFNDKRFCEDATKLVRFCAENKVKPANAFLSPNAPGILFPDAPPQARTQSFNRLKTNWNAYFAFMGLTADTIVQRGELPHCQKIGEIFEKSTCRFNPHTDLCNQYRRALSQLPDATLALENDYRQWRKSYLAGPRKPVFRYPSSRDLPMPKIFGSGFHEIDFDRSVLRLRLDDMPAGQWIEFGFIPWPRGYEPSKKDVNVTSIHVNFVGTRVRAGFRFDAPPRSFPLCLCPGRNRRTARQAIPPSCAGSAISRCRPPTPAGNILR